LNPDDEWFTNKITKNIDIIVLGSNVKKDNPGLIKAKV